MEEQDALGASLRATFRDYWRATKVAVPREVVILVAYFTRHPQGVVPGELWS